MQFDIRNLLFSLSGFMPETELEKNLSEKNLSLEEYLKKEEAIQCFKDMKKNAQNYFTRDKIRQLIKYITEEPEEDEFNRGYQYPYVASEMLKSAGERIQEMIVFSKEEFNKKYKIEINDKISNKENSLIKEEKKEENKEDKIEEHKENEIKEEIKDEKVLVKNKDITIEIIDENSKENSFGKEKEDKRQIRKINIDKHNELLDLLLDFITKKNGGLNDVLCGYFSSVLLSLLNMYPCDIFLYLLFVRRDALEQIVMHSYQKSLSNISSKILKFEQYYLEIKKKNESNPGMIDLELLNSKKSAFEDFRTKLLEKIITSIDLNGFKDQNGNYLEGIDIESIFLVLYDLLEDVSIIFPITYDNEIKEHVFNILEENIFDENNNIINEKKKNMYNYFVIFLSKMLYNLPKMKKTNDKFYPEFDYSNIFEKIKNKKPLSFNERLIILIPKIITVNFQEISILKNGPLGLHNIYIMDLVLAFLNYAENKPTLFDFIILESGFMDKSISYFFKHQLNNIYHSKFVQLFDKYLKKAENHPLLTDYFFNKKKFHLILLNFINEEKESEYLNKYQYKTGKTTISCMYIYVIDLIYKIQAASGLKLLEEKSKKDLNILNYGYFEFLKDEKATKDIINLKMPKYVTDILSESKKWIDTMENKIIPLIKKYEGKLCFSKGMKPKEMQKTTLSQGLLNLITLIAKNKVQPQEKISDYNDINFWKVKNDIPNEIKDKVNSNLNNNTNSNNDDIDEEDELLNIAMNLEKQEGDNKKAKSKIISLQPKINITSKNETNNSSNNPNINNNEIKTNSVQSKDKK